jgi:1-deoxy-D-xylulose-5-phosphate reductoisomerase
VVTASGQRRVTILGATGSIGLSTIDVVAAEPERYAIEAVTAHTNVEGLAEIARKTRARVAVIADPGAYQDLKSALSGTGIEVAAGDVAIVEAAARPSDIVMAAIVGAAGLAPTLRAVGSGARVALANKETLVCAGALFLDAVRAAGAEVLPVDSEHNAIFQLLDGRDPNSVERIVLTASGGPFRTWSREAMARATPVEALKHPNWTMGRKVTIDSATLMNKGLELIEAHHLFGAAPERLDVVVHPQSIVHGMVTLRDGSVLAAMSAPDMRTPIAHALAWPAHPSAGRRLDLATIGTLSFEAPDPARFPALGLARSALAIGGAATNILNAANEIAVAAYLSGSIGFLEIAGLVAETLDRAAVHDLGRAPSTIEESLDLVREGRRIATDIATHREAV